MQSYPIALYIAVMAGVTYLIRMLPMTVFTGKIQSRFVRSFLFYVPYAVLGAMTFPAILFSTGSLVSALCGFAAALLLSLCNRGLLTVAVCGCAVVYLVEWILQLWR